MTPSAILLYSQLFFSSCISAIHDNICHFNSLPSSWPFPFILLHHDMYKKNRKCEYIREYISIFYLLSVDVYFNLFFKVFLSFFDFLSVLHHTFTADKLCIDANMQ